MNTDIVLIPGSLATPNIWKHQIEYFRQGRIFHYVNVFNSDSIKNMAERFIKDSPKKFTLAGFSMGGYVALELFKYIPEKIDKLILINTAAKSISNKGILERKRSLELVEQGKFEFLIKFIFNSSFFDKEKLETLRPFIRQMALEVGEENYKKQLNAMLNKEDHSELLTKVNCPTLIIGCEQDQVMPFERSEHLANNIKDSKLVSLDNCGHLALLEQPEKINKELDNWF